MNLDTFNKKCSKVSVNFMSFSIPHFLHKILNLVFDNIL